jgi:hypothetical protein
MKTLMLGSINEGKDGRVWGTKGQRLGKLGQQMEEGKD